VRRADRHSHYPRGFRIAVDGLMKVNSPPRISAAPFAAIHPPCVRSQALGNQRSLVQLRCDPRLDCRGCANPPRTESRLVPRVYWAHQNLHSSHASARTAGPCQKVRLSSVANSKPCEIRLFAPTEAEVARSPQSVFLVGVSFFRRAGRRHYTLVTTDDIQSGTPRGKLDCSIIGQWRGSQSPSVEGVAKTHNIGWRSVTTSHLR
jgi:hypothetical protein